MWSVGRPVTNYTRSRQVMVQRTARYSLSDGLQHHHSLHLHLACRHLVTAVTIDRRGNLRAVGSGGRTLNQRVKRPPSRVTATGQRRDVWFWQRVWRAAPWQRISAEVSRPLEVPRAEWLRPAGARWTPRFGLEWCMKFLTRRAPLSRASESRLSRGSRRVR